MITNIKKTPLVFILFYLSYSSIYIARINFSVAAALLQSGGINASLIGVIGSIFFFLYALSKLINGYVGDRVSPKIMIVSGMILTGVSNIVIGIAPVYRIIALCWGVNAFGQAMIWGPMLRYLTFDYDTREMKAATALLISSVSAGSVAGLLVGGHYASSSSVSMCFLIPGLIVIVMCIFVILVLPNSNIMVKENKREHIKNALLKKEFMLMVTPAVMQGMIKDNMNVWMAVYFVDVFEINIKNIGGYILFLPLMGLIGRFMYPVLYNIFRRNEYHVSVFAFSVCILAVLPLFMGTADSITAVVCLGLISAMVSIVNTHMLSTLPAHFADTGNISFVASTMDVLAYGGAGIGSLLFGVIIQNYGYSGMYIIWGCISLISILFLEYGSLVKKKELALQREINNIPEINNKGEAI